MSYPTEFFRYEGGQLAADGVALLKVADRVGTPAYVYSARGFLQPLRELQRGLKGLDTTVCFAVKSCSNLSVLRMLGSAGAGMDLVSGGELHRAALAGVPGEKIVFSGVGKTPGEMASALEYRSTGGKVGIWSFNVESTAEIETLNAVAKHLNRTARIALRFNPDVDAKTHPYISTGLRKNKFGLNRLEILKIARTIGRYPHLRLEGVSMHIGSQLLSFKPIEDAFKRLRQLIRELDAILEHPLTFADLGGGVGIAYEGTRAPKLKDYCKLVQKHFGPRAGLVRPLKLFFEPGRAIAGNAGVLLTEVLHRKARDQKDFLVVDAAMNDLLRPSLYGSHHEIVPVRKKAATGAKKKTDVVGPVCETGDRFAEEIAVPRGIDSGELLAILSAGAYGFSMSGNYNSRPRPPEVLLIDGKIKVIRVRETYDDLVRGEIIEL